MIFNKSALFNVVLIGISLVYTVNHAYSQKLEFRKPSDSLTVDTASLRNKIHSYLYRSTKQSNAFDLPKFKTSKLIDSSVQQNTKKVNLSVVKFKVSGFIDTRHSNWQDSFTFIPSRYVRVGISPNFSIKDIPITANIFYTTEKGPISNLRNINVSLDIFQVQNLILAQMSGKSQAIQQQIIGARVTSEYKNQLRNPENYFDINDVEEVSPDTLISSFNNSNYLNELPKDKYQRLHDSISIYQPQNLGKLDSMYLLGKLIQLIPDSFEMATDTLSSVSPQLVKRAKQLRRLKSYTDYKRPSNLIGKGDSLYKQGMISKKEAILLNFKKFSIGDIYPNYGAFIINGTRVRGAEIIYNKAPYVIGGSGGVSKQIRYTGFTKPTEIRKDMAAGLLGFENEKRMFKLALVRFWDPNYSSTNENSSISPNIFKENFIIQTQTAVKYKGFQVFSEVAYSQKDQYPLQYKPKENAITEKTNEKLNLNTAYLLKVSYKIKKTNTRLIAQTQRIGTNYYSFGTPFLRTDIKQYRAEIEQNLFRRYVKINVFLMKEEDNLNNLKPSTAKLTSPGGTFSITIPKLPFLTVSYLPFDQQIQSELDSFFMDSKYRTWTLQSGYQYKIGTFLLFSGLSGTQQTQYFSRYLAPSFNRNISFTNLIRAQKELTLSASIGWTNTIFSKDTLNLFNYDLQLSGKIRKNIQIGCHYSKGSSYYSIIRQTFGADISLQTKKKNCWLLSVNYNMLTKAERNTGRFYDISLKYRFNW